MHSNAKIFYILINALLPMDQHFWNMLDTSLIYLNDNKILIFQSSVHCEIHYTDMILSSKFGVVF